MGEDGASPPLPPTPDRVFLRARSRRQAADWSLVLLSQGIENEPDRSDERWGIWVDEREAKRSRSILELYRRENRRWFWLRRPGAPGLAWHPGAVSWALTLLLLFGWQCQAPGWLEAHGRLDAAAVRSGEWWRLLTAITLHADV